MSCSVTVETLHAVFGRRKTSSENLTRQPEFMGFYKLLKRHSIPNDAETSIDLHLQHKNVAVGRLIGVQQPDQVGMV